MYDKFLEAKFEKVYALYISMANILSAPGRLHTQKIEWDFLILHVGKQQNVW